MPGTRYSPRFNSRRVNLKIAKVASESCWRRVRIEQEDGDGTLACLRNVMIIAAMNQFRVLDQSRGISFKNQIARQLPSFQCTASSLISFVAATSSTYMCLAKSVPRQGSQSMDHRTQLSWSAYALFQPCVQLRNAHRSQPRSCAVHHAS